MHISNSLFCQSAYFNNSAAGGPRGDTAPRGVAPHLRTYPTGNARQSPRHRYGSALFMRAGGRARGGSYGGSSSSISADWVAVEGAGAGGAAAGINMLPDEEDVPNTVDHNGEVRGVATAVLL